MPEPEVNVGPKPPDWNKIYTPGALPDPESVLFDLPIRAVRARAGSAHGRKPIVIMIEPETVIARIEYQGREINFERTIESSQKNQPDIAVVYDPDGVPDLKRGDMVAVRAYAGTWLSHAQLPEIPQGRLVKILGTAKHWSQDILCIIEPDKAAA